MKISNRISKMPTSSIRELYPIADRVKAEGIKVYHLNIGDPDIKTPDEFFAAIRDCDIETLGYASARGITELLKAQIEYYSRYGIEVQTEDLAITNGGSEAILYAILSVTDHGDTILTSEPYYANYTPEFVQAGVEAVVFPTTVETGFHLPSKEVILNSIKPNTKAILLSNPGNPTGVVYTKEEINLLAEIAKEKNLFIISDEVYREFIYSDEPYYGFGHVEGIEDRLIICDSISKRFSACGARIGSIMSKNKDVMKGVLALCNARLAAPTMEQLGAANLYKTDSGYLKEINREYKSRRDFLVKRLNAMQGVVVYEPEGAFYLMPELPVENAAEFSKWLLGEFSVNGETLMMAPGFGFYKEEEKGKSQVRLAYVLNKEALAKAMDILEAGIEEYKRINS